MVKKKPLPNVQVVLYIDKPRTTMSRVYPGDYRVMLQQVTRRDGADWTHTLVTWTHKTEAEAKAMYDTFCV